MITLDSPTIPAQTEPRPNRRHWPLLVFTAAMIALTVVSVGGLLFDHRLLGGVPIWLKPLKFSVSLAIYGATLMWLLSLQTRFRAIGWLTGTVTTVCGLGEMVLIIVQVVRGQASHFNIGTPLDATIYGIMGSLASGIFLCMFVLAALLAWQPMADRALRWGIRFGLLSSLAGMGLATLMLNNVGPDERAADRAGTLTMHGGHSIGVPDGGPAMPITGWSTTGGDLRIPHFVGLHGLQVLPLVALLLAAAGGRWSVLRAERTRIQLVCVAAVGYAGLIGLVTWQALRGQSIVHPDLPTIGAVVLLLVVVAGGTIAVLSRARDTSGQSIR